MPLGLDVGGATWKRPCGLREALALAEPAGALAVQGRAYFTIGFVRGVAGVLDERTIGNIRAVSRLPERPFSVPGQPSPHDRG
jgi:hypothetical protein